MKYIASVSGGKDSCASLILAAENREPLDEVVYCEVMFDAETSGEMPEHIDFINTRLKPFVERELQVPFVHLRSKKTYLDAFNHIITRGNQKGKTHGFPLPQMCLINRDCKIPPISAYWKRFEEDVTQYVGIASDEVKRNKRLEGTNKMSLLVKYGYTEKAAKELCSKYGLLSPIYEFTNRNGCWFCPNCKKSEFEHMIYNHPKLFDRLVDLESTPNLYRRCLTVTETPSQIKRRTLLTGLQPTFFDIEKELENAIIH